MDRIPTSDSVLLAKSPGSNVQYAILVEDALMIENGFLAKNFGGNLYKYLSDLADFADAAQKKNRDIPPMGDFLKYRNSLLESHGESAMGDLEDFLGLNGSELFGENYGEVFAKVNLENVLKVTMYLGSYLQPEILKEKERIAQEEDVRFWSLEWRQEMRQALISAGDGSPPEFQMQSAVEELQVQFDVLPKEESPMEKQTDAERERLLSIHEHARKFRKAAQEYGGGANPEVPKALYANPFWAKAGMLLQKLNSLITLILRG